MILLQQTDLDRDSSVTATLLYTATDLDPGYLPLACSPKP